MYSRGASLGRCCAGSPVPSAPPRPGRPRAPPRLAPRWRGKLGRREASWWYVLGDDETSLAPSRISRMPDPIVSPCQMTSGLLLRWPRGSPC